MSDINRSRMIPLHVCDQAVAACEAEIQKLREENARLKEEGEHLRGIIHGEYPIGMAKDLTKDWDALVNNRQEGGQP